MVTDRNLLIAIHALRSGAIDGDQFARLSAAWATDRSRPIGDRLLALGWVDEAGLARIERMADDDLRDHGGDLHATLADLAGPSDGRASAPTLETALPDGPDDLLTMAVGMPGPMAGPTRAIGSADADPGATSALDHAEAGEGHFRVSAIAGVGEARTRYARSHLHARGGIGQVWLAVDSDLGREVALKELRPEQATNRAAWDRFSDEARITGQLEHPGIVPVYEFAFSGGDHRPFYTMRFIRGGTLADAIHAYHKKRVAGEAGPLDLASLLNAFVAACNAIGYAHSREIIHRDLKGQNIVLGDFGEVMVLDWGLAKRVGQPDAPITPAGPAPVGLDPAHMATLPGQVLGTPSYMAPEQAEGRIEAVDHRTDIYGLGAILYEILADRPPHAGTTTDELLRRVREEEPTPPRMAVPETPRALEAICLKAMARQPEDRYASALDLAGDVRRWLADEPVSAFRDRWPVRLGRWGKRHRTAVASAAALLITAVLVLSVAAVLIDRERAEVRRQRDQARLQRRLARQAVDEMYTQVAEQWLEDRLDPVQRAMLERAADYYARFAEHDDADPEVRQERGRAFGRLGDVLRKLGRHDEAERNYRRAVAELEALAGDTPGDPTRRDALAHAISRLGSELAARGGAVTLAEAERLDRRALALQVSAIEGGPTPRRLLDGARTERDLADLLRVTGRAPEAIAAYRDAVDRLDRALAKAPDEVAARQEQAVALDGLGMTLRDQEKPDEAEMAFRKSIELFERLLAQAPTQPQHRDGLARALNGLGLLARDARTSGEAEVLERRVIEINGRLAEDYPDRPEYRRALARGLLNLGILLKESGRTKEAEPAYRRALELDTALADQFPDVPIYRRDLARCLNNLADLVMATSPRPAEEMFRKALALNEALAARSPGVPEYRAGVAGVLSNLGRCLKASGQVEPALEFFRRGADLFDPLIVADPANPNYRRDQAACLNNLGNALTGLGRHGEAEEAFRRAVGRLDELVALPSPRQGDRLELATVLSNRGDNQTACKLPGAEATFDRALEQFGQLVAEPGAAPPARAGLAIARLNFGDWLAANGRGDEAEASFGESVRILDGLASGDPAMAGYRPLLAEALGHRAAHRLARGRTVDARSDLEWAARIERPMVEANPRGPIRARLRARVASLVAVLVDLGDHAEAARECEEWLRLSHDQPGVRVMIARALVRCAARAMDDAAVPEARRVALAGSYQDRAASMLREAVERGDAEATPLLLDEAFAPIRSRDGFKALVVGQATKPVSSGE